MTSRFLNSRKLSFILCCSAILFWFSPWWINGKNLAPLDIIHEMMQPWRGVNTNITVKNHIVADAVDQYLIYRMVAAESYKKEGWLGWSSLTYGGTPQYANTMALYYDWTMQLHRWFDFWTAWHIGLMGQVLLAASGMMLFLRNRYINSVWSTCGAIAYAANSQFVTWVYHRWALGAFCWVPWALWAIDSYKAGKIRFWALVPIFISLSFLGGTLQHCAIVVLAIVAMSFEEIINSGLNTTAIKQIILRYVVWGLLATGLAAMMLLPCIDTFLTSNRLGLHTGTYGNSSAGLYPQGWTQPFFNLAAYPIQFFPSIFGRCNSLDLLKLFKSDLFYIAYFGSLPVVIAILSFFKKETPKVSLVLIGIGLILPLTPLVRYLYQRLFILFILGGIYAFCYYMTFSTRESRLKLFYLLIKFTLFVILCWLFISLILSSQYIFLLGFLENKFLNLSAGSSFGYFREWMQGRFRLFLTDLSILSAHQLIPLGLFIISLLALRVTTSLNYKKRKLGELLLVAVVFIELTLFGARWVTFTDQLKYPLYPINHDVASIKEIVKDGMTFTQVKDNIGHMALTPFVSNTLSAYGIKSILGYDSIVPNGMNMTITNHCNYDMFGHLGVTHMIAYRGSTPNHAIWNMVWESPSLVLYENRKPTSKYIGFVNELGLNSFFNSSLIEASTSLIETTHLENQRRLVVPEGIKFIRIAENHSEGWKYRVLNALNPAWQPVLRATDATMLLSISNNTGSGPFTIEMQYEPYLRKLGFLVSALSLILTLLIGILYKTKLLIRGFES